MDTSQLTFGWAESEREWHRIDAMSEIGGSGVSSLHTSCGLMVDPSPIEQTVPEGGEKCRQCWALHMAPNVAEYAWGEPDDHLHVLTLPGVWPMRFGHYHGQERAEFEVVEVVEGAQTDDLVYRCSCGEQITTSRPRM